MNLLLPLNPNGTATYLNEYRMVPSFHFFLFSTSVPPPPPTHTTPRFIMYRRVQPNTVSACWTWHFTLSHTQSRDTLRKTARMTDARMKTSAIVCVLVLVTGLPASGKSSLIASLSTVSSDDDRVAQPNVAHIFQIDAVMASLRNPTEGASDAFVPGQWRLAQASLHAQVETALETVLCCARLGIAHSQSEPVALPLVLVEDNMHLRSMREFYWRLCRRVEARFGAQSECAAHEGSSCVEWTRLIAMVELRLTVPKEECVRRNAARHALDSESTSDTPVPNYVVDAMAETFEACAAPSSGSPTLVCGAWSRLACTHPWPVLTLNVQQLRDASDVADGARRILSQSLGDLVEEQHHAIERYWSRMRDNAADGSPSLPQAGSASQSEAHLFDLQLRATVRHFIKEYGSLLTPETQRRVHAAKRTCLQKRKSLLASSRCDTSDDLRDEKQSAEQELIVQFQAKLLSVVFPDGQVRVL